MRDREAKKNQGEPRDEGDAMTVDRLEILADDLIRRLEKRHRHDPQALGDDVVAAAARLKALIAEVGATWDMGGEQKVKLIETQGRLIQGLRREALAKQTELAEACQRIAGLADERRQLEERLAALGAYRTPTPPGLADALKAEGRAELEAWQKRCRKCERPMAEHKRGGSCPDEKPTEKPTQ